LFLNTIDNTYNHEKNMQVFLITPKDEAVIKAWLLANLHEVLNDLEVIPSISFNLPADIGRANASQVKSINSVDLKDVKLVSLSYLKVKALISVSLNVSVDVSWDDYLSSSEVRELVGESKSEFVFISLDTHVELTLGIQFELLKEPPMVASYKVLSVDGSTGGCYFT
jgi:hypothetical protein